MNPNKFLSAEDVQKIEQRVADVESRTSGEIVPMIASSSSVRGHVMPIVFMILVGLYLTFLAGEMFFDIGAYSIMVQTAIFSLVAFFVSYFATYSDFVLRLVTFDDDTAAQVERRAEIEFWRAGLHKTDGSTGVLLFVSLAEHWAVVLADESISKKLPPETWKEVADTLVSGIKSKQFAKGFEDAIDRCGKILEEHFPIRPQDKNELPNKVVITD